MSEHDFSVVDTQLIAAKQKLAEYRNITGNVVAPGDSLRRIHDAVQALQIAVDSLAGHVKMIEENTRPPKQSIAQQLRGD